MSKIIESQRLTFSEGSSDKFYEVMIREGATSGYVVDFSYGRIGTAGNAGTKTPNPVSLSEAQATMRKLVSEKQKKGYRLAGQAQNAAVQPSDAAQPTKLALTGAQLCNPVDAADLDAYLSDPDWAVQEKFDGVRTRAIRAKATWFGMNRRGLRVSLPAVTVEALKRATVGFGDADIDLDGELVGTVYHVFDVLKVGGRDITGKSFEQRQFALADFISEADAKLAPVATDEAQKRAVLEAIRRGNREGIVLRRRTAPYTPGRPGSGGDVLKFKLVETCTVRVTAINKKRSVALAAMGEFGPVAVGNVTIPANAPIPAVDDLIEVQYLYYFEGGSLFQPVYKTIRTDIDGADSVASLKRKGTGADTESPEAVVDATLRKVSLAGGAQVSPAAVF